MNTCSLPQGVATAHSAQLLLAAEYFTCKPKQPASVGL